MGVEVNEKKGGKGVVVFIILLILIIIGLCGYICYEKGVFDKFIKTNDEEEKASKSDKEKDFDTTKAKELVDKYYVEMLWDNIFTSETGIDGMAKDVIAVNNMVNSKKKLASCYHFYENNPSAQKDTANSYAVTLKSDVFSIKYGGGGCDNGSADYYEYNDLNSTYKYLFGKNNDMPKSDFSLYGRVFDYIEDKDVFVQLDCRCGGAQGPHYKNHFVQSAKVKGDDLTINIGYVYMKPSDDNGDDPMLSATIGGEQVSYKSSETLKDTFEKEFTDKYLDKLDTYTFTFKYEDDHYVFVEMAKK